MTLLTVPDRPLGCGRPFAIYSGIPRRSSLGWIVHGVLDSMLPTEVPVPLPGEPLRPSFDSMEWQGNGRLVATDWLPAVCHCITTGRLHGQLAQYATSLGVALLRGDCRYGRWGPTRPTESRLPAGRASLWCEVRIGQDAIESAEFCWTEGAISYLVAHEIIHAVNTLGIVAPALSDWDTFQRSFRTGENTASMTIDWLSLLDQRLHAASGDQERDMFCRFWDRAQVDEWFDDYELLLELNAPDEANPGAEPEPIESMAGPDARS